MIKVDTKLVTEAELESMIKLANTRAGQLLQNVRDWTKLLDAARSLLDKDAIDAKWLEGYRVGFHWPSRWNHRPGGPWVYRNRSGETEAKWLLLAEQSAAEHEAWLKGWDNGNAHKLANLNPLNIKPLLED